MSGGFGRGHDRSNPHLRAIQQLFPAAAQQPEHRAGMSRSLLALSPPSVYPQHMLHWSRTSSQACKDRILLYV